MIEHAIDALDTVQDPGEVPLQIRSRLDRPIGEMSFLKRSLLFAELAMIAYNDPDEAERAIKKIGFTESTFYDRDGSQAYRFRNREDCVIACRGTEPNEWNDIRADANARAVLAETAGKVHQGFKIEVDDLWPMLETALMHNDQPLHFCGHSLGGAMATICAGRCFLSHIDTNPCELFTYGSPRVGDHRYINFVKLKHFRYVNNNDIVTRVPPPFLGYRHAGDMVYLNRDGQIKKYGHIGMRRDRWKGFFKGIGRWKIDHFADHSIHAYIESIAAAVAAEESSGEILGPEAYSRSYHRSLREQRRQAAEQDETP